MDVEACGFNCECLYKLLDIKKPPDTIQVLKSSAIKAQYKKRMLLIHPDRTNDPRSHITAVLLNQALALLSDRGTELDYRLNGLAFVHNHKHTLEESSNAIQFMTESLNKTKGSKSTDTIKASETTTRRRSLRVQDKNKNRTLAHGSTPKLNAHRSHSPQIESKHASAPKSNIPNDKNPLEERSDHQIAESTYRFKQQTSLTADRTKSAKSPLTKLSKLWTLKYRAHNLKREIARIIDHNIRPAQVYFIVEWAIDGSQDLVEAETLILDNGHRLKLYSYLERVRLNAPTRFDYLVKKSPILWDVYDI